MALGTLSKMKKGQLKEECRQRNLPVSGNKRDLIARLEQTVRSAPLPPPPTSAAAAASPSVSSSSGSNNNNNNNNSTSKSNHQSNAKTPAAATKEDAEKMSSRQNGKKSGGAGAKSQSNHNNGGGKDSKTRSVSRSRREQLKEERESIVIWRKPITTIHYASIELCYTLVEWIRSLLSHKTTLVLLALLAAAVNVLYRVEGPHQQYMAGLETYLYWLAWWVGLGVLSSVGLGTGLHTFLLYLGPHIAAVTLAAYECGSVDFPEPPYPDSIVCPDEDAAGKSSAMTVWTILSKVRIEAFCWGVGTALGELPPYFMARAHRLSGYDPDEEEDEYDELMEMRQHQEDLGLFDRAKLGVERIVEKVGFFGILACASIPNPLFDLAGITCGHFLVPFWTFFGATVIGKAVIKMHIQKLFVIFAFNENLISSAVHYLSLLPVVGPKLEAPFKELLANQKAKLHRKSDAPGGGGDGGLLSWLFEKLILAMVAFFLISIVNSLAQGYHKRINKKHAKEDKDSKAD